MLGTRGVPAQYGGFETAVEEVGSRLSAMGCDVVVYCRNPQQQILEHRGMTLRNVPALRRRSLETLSHTLMSILSLFFRERHVDAALVFNAGNAPLLPLLRLRRIPFAVHMDGLEWKRAKWLGFGARYYRWAERFSIRTASTTISDARAIQDYLADTYAVHSQYIPYGTSSVDPKPDLLVPLGLDFNGYHLVVARFEPENYVLEIVQGYVLSSSTTPLVVVGSAPYSTEYSAAITEASASDARVRLLGGVWDQDLLDQLYACAATYLHGQSVGGTNPSLLRALGAGTPVTAVDVIFNREVTGGHAVFVQPEPDDIARAINQDDGAIRSTSGRLPRGAAGQSHALETYNWDSVAEAYHALCVRLAGRESH